MKQLSADQRRELNEIAARAAAVESLGKKLTSVADKTVFGAAIMVAAPLTFIASIPRLLDPRRIVRKGLAKGVELGAKPFNRLEEKIETRETENEEWIAAVKEGKFLDHDYETEERLVAGLRKLRVKGEDLNSVRAMLAEETPEPVVQQVKASAKTAKAVTTEPFQAAHLTTSVPA